MKGATLGGVLGFANAFWMGVGGYSINNKARLPSPIFNCSYYEETYLSIINSKTTTGLPTSTMMTVAASDDG